MEVGFIICINHNVSNRKGGREWGGLLREQGAVQLGLISPFSIAVFPQHASKTMNIYRGRYIFCSGDVACQQQERVRLFV